MYWRLLAAIVFAVFAAYWFGKKPVAAPVPIAQAAPVAVPMPPVRHEAVKEAAPDTIAAAPPVAPVAMQSAPADAAADSVDKDDEPPSTYTLDLAQEGQRIAAATGVSVANIAVSYRLPIGSPMAMTMRTNGCTLLLNAGLPFGDGLVLTGLTLYQQRQLTFTLAHELGHCYMQTRVAERDVAFLTSLSPPGKSYNFEQYAAMSAHYSEYPDLNRWNEEWADTFAAYALARAYGKDFATSITAERYSLRKRQERNGDVLTSNVYGGHGSLKEEAIFSIESPLEIANLVKIGRLNTSR